MENTYVFTRQIEESRWDCIFFFFGINADEEGSKCHHLFCMLHTSTTVSSKLTQIALGMFFSYHHLIKAARRQSWYYIKEKCFISLLITILVCIEGSNVPTTYLYQNMFYVLSQSENNYASSSHYNHIDIPFLCIILHGRIKMSLNIVICIQVFHSYEMIELGLYF